MRGVTKGCLLDEMESITQDVSWKRKMNRGYTILTYQAQCGHFVGSWLLEQCAEETAAGCCGQNILCVMCVLQLTDRIHQ